MFFSKTKKKSNGQESSKNKSVDARSLGRDAKKGKKMGSIFSRNPPPPTEQLIPYLTDETLVPIFLERPNNPLKPGPSLHKILAGPTDSNTIKIPTSSPVLSPVLSADRNEVEEDKLKNSPLKKLPQTETSVVQSSVTEKLRDGKKKKQPTKSTVASQINKIKNRLQNSDTKSESKTSSETKNMSSDQMTLKDPPPFPAPVQRTLGAVGGRHRTPVSAIKPSNLAEKLKNRKIQVLIDDFAASTASTVLSNVNNFKASRTGKMTPSSGSMSAMPVQTASANSSKVGRKIPSFSLLRNPTQKGAMPSTSMTPSRPKKEFEDLDFKLGHGAFAEVYKIRRKESKKLYALKVIRIDGQNPLENALKEVKQLRDFQGHKNKSKYIVDFVDSWYAQGEDPKNKKWMDKIGAHKGQVKGLLFIQLEFCNEGTLQMKLEGHRPSDIILKTWFLQVVKGLMFLHDHNVIHRDLHVSNILLHRQQDVGERGSVVAKIADFGISRIRKRGADSQLTKRLGHSFYTAPEQAWSQDYSNKVDIFSLGVILLSILQPFHKSDGQTDLNVFECYPDLKESKNSKTFKPIVVPPELQRRSPTMAKFIQQMASEKPQERPTAKKVFSELSGWWARSCGPI